MSRTLQSSSISSRIVSSGSFWLALMHSVSAPTSLVDAMSSSAPIVGPVDFSSLMSVRVAASLLGDALLLVFGKSVVSMGG